MSVCVRVHANRNHNLVRDLRDCGELHSMLVGWLQPPSAREDEKASKAGAVAPAAAGSAAGGAAAYEAAASAALAAGDGLGGLATIDRAIMLAPERGVAWELRARALVHLKRYADVYQTVGVLQVLAAAGRLEPHVAAGANKAMSAAKSAQASLGQRLIALSQASDQASDAVGRVKAWEQAAALDPTNVYARHEVAESEGIASSFVHLHLCKGLAASAEHPRSTHHLLTEHRNG